MPSGENMSRGVPRTGGVPATLFPFRILSTTLSTCWAFALVYGLHILFSRASVSLVPWRAFPGDAADSGVLRAGSNIVEPAWHAVRAAT
jgi:hypothetical protein